MPYGSSLRDVRSGHFCACYPETKRSSTAMRIIAATDRESTNIDSLAKASKSFACAWNEI